MATGNGQRTRGNGQGGSGNGGRGSGTRHPTSDIGHQSYDWVNDILVPLCVLGVLFSFTRFCLDVRTALAPTGTTLLRYVLFWFLLAVVGIVKIRGLYGDQAAAAPYTLALAGAVLLFLLRFTSEAGRILGGTGGWWIAFLMNATILGLIWWGADSITRDCTVNEFTEEAEAPGLLAELSGGSADSPRTRRRPGRSIFHFSIAALIVFGLGQPALARAPTEVVRSAQISVTAYVAFALCLLALTNLSGLRKYLRRRRVGIPAGMLPAWIIATAITTAIVLLLATALPKSGLRGGGDELAGASVTVQGRGRGLSEAPASGFAQSEGGRARHTAPGEPRGSQGPAARDDSGPGNNQGRGQGGEKTGQQAKGEKGQGAEQGTTGGGQGAKAEGRGDSEGQGRGTGGEAGQRSQAGSPTPHSPPPTPHFATPAGLVNWLVWLLIIGLVIAALIVYRDRIAAALRHLISALSCWRNLLGGWRLPGLRRASRSEKKVFSNPFEDASVFEQLPPRELILHTYGGFMALADGMGCPRSPDQTPFEFLRMLPASLKHLVKEARTLSHLYMLAEYDDHPDLSGYVDRLREIWEKLDAEARRIEALRREQRAA